MFDIKETLNNYSKIYRQCNKILTMFYKANKLNCCSYSHRPIVDYIDYYFDSNKESIIEITYTIDEYNNTREITIPENILFDEENIDDYILNYKRENY
jgi:hypothetical protein